MNSLKRIAHVKIPYLPLSETFIYERITKLKKFEGIILTDREMQNLTLFPFPRIYQMKEISDLSRFLQRQDVHLIHAYFGTAGVRMLPYKLETGIPMVTSFHGVDVSARLRNKNYKQLLQKLFKKGDLFFSVSYSMKRKLIKLGCPAEKIKVVKTGIDFRKYNFKPRSKPKTRTIQILSVGRLVPKKGMDLLLLAFAKVHKKHPRTKLVIVGTGQMEKQLKQLRRKLKLQNVVIISGALSHEQVRKQMMKSHIFVLASRTASNGDQEGIPNAIIEAMASGLPVVSTRHSGIPEVVRHHRTGLLAKPDSAADLAKKIESMLKYPNRWKRYTRTAYRVVKKKHDIRKQMRKVQKHYKALLQKMKKT